MATHKVDTANFQADVLGADVSGCCGFLGRMVRAL